MAAPKKPAKVAAKPKTVDVWAFAYSPQARAIDAAQKGMKATESLKQMKTQKAAAAKERASKAAITTAAKPSLKNRRGKIDRLMEKF